MKKFKIGEFYESCRYHPVMVTIKSGDNIEGISLIDGSYPNSCSIRSCGIRKISIKEAIKIALNWDKHPYKDWKWKKYSKKEIEIHNKKCQDFVKLIGWGKTNRLK
jgi:hypothetical protein